MIYLFAGDDAKNKLSSYEKFLKKEAKGRDVFFVSRNNWDPVQIESLYSGSSLFSSSSVIVFQSILEHEEGREFILEKLSNLADSDSDFIFIESKLPKSILDAFKKAKGEVNIFELPKEKKEKFDNFKVANAFGNKDKLNTWIYFRQAIEAGVALEELVGILFWKVKDMILKGSLSRFKEEELKTFAARLSYLLPQARKAGVDAESALEQFLLEAF